jgi:hypothetical protein
VHVEPSHWRHENYGLEIDCHHFFCMGSYPYQTRWIAMLGGSHIL